MQTDEGLKLLKIGIVFTKIHRVFDDKVIRIPEICFYLCSKLL